MPQCASVLLGRWCIQNHFFKEIPIALIFHLGKIRKYLEGYVRFSNFPFSFNSFFTKNDKNRGSLLPTNFFSYMVTLKQNQFVHSYLSKKSEMNNLVMLMSKVSKKSNFLGRFYYYTTMLFCMNYCLNFSLIFVLYHTHFILSWSYTV